MITLSCGTSTISLPNPILGDSEQVDTKIKFEYSMSKAVHTTKRTYAHSKLLFSFGSLTTTEKTSLYNFLIAQRGKYVTYTDYNGDAHAGILLGDTFEFVQVSNKLVNATYEDSLDCEELWSITLELEARTL